MAAPHPCPHLQEASFLPVHQPVVYKDECTLCFDTQDAPGGVDVCLTCFNGGCTSEERHHGVAHHQKTTHPLALNIKRVPKRNALEGPKPPKITKLAIAEEAADTEKYDHHTQLKCYHCDTLVPATELPETVQGRVNAILYSLSATRQSEIKAWEENEPVTCAHVQTLVQEPMDLRDVNVLQHCVECNLKENLWLCLTCGNVGCGRRQFDGSGGNDHGVLHYEKTGHPVSCKLGTITPEGDADLYCYRCDDACTDPALASHLQTFGISVANARKTEKSMAELQLAKNIEFDFSMTTEDGQQLQPIFGPGLTGLSNLGNSCYMSSVLQCVMALPEFRRRYEPIITSHPATCTLGPPKCFFCQTVKLMDGLWSGRYSVPSMGLIDATDTPKGQDGIAPRMYKMLVGNEHPEFSTMRQQDAYEFLQHLLKVTEQKERAVDGGSADPAQFFRFRLEERLQCLTCQGVRYSTSDTSSLPVPLPLGPEQPNTPVTLDQCLDLLTSDVTVEGYACPQCHTSTTVRKRQRFHSFPQILVLHMQRFRLVNWVPEKVNTPVQLPTQGDGRVGDINLDGYRGRGLQPGETELPREIPTQASVETTVDKGVLSQLMAMGFPEIRCRRALLHTHNNGAEAAMNWLFEHLDDPDIDEPLPVASESVPSLNDADVSMLMEMGFSQNHASQALQATDGQMERAVEWIFSHPEDAETATGQSSSLDVPIPSDSTLPGHYRLASFVSHKGTSVHCGHYVAHVWREDLNQWVLFNDNKVVVAPNPPVDAAYIYFLHRAE
ncbi:ubiquitin C-terminal hydrolase Ubp14 [Dispira simplex]|nr:ubiquitin C-terminal hydrolase Ubp14 [Dispira simplex]